MSASEAQAPVSATRLAEAAVRCYAAGEAEQAIQLIRGAVYLAQDVPTLARLGSYLASEGAYQAALACYQKGLSLAPQDLGLHLGLTHCYVGLGQFELALASSRQAVALGPESALAWHDHGVALERIGLDREALEAFSHALACSSGEFTGLHAASHAQTWFARALVYARLSRFPQAEADLREALRHGLRTPEAYLELQALLRRQGRLVEAAAVVDEALGVHVGSYALWMAQAEVQRDRALWEQALASYAQAAALEPTKADPYICRAEVYTQGYKDDEQCLTELRLALAVDEQAHMAWVRLHQVLRRRRCYDEARLCLERAVQVAPEQAPVLSILIFAADHDDAYTLEQRWALRQTYEQRFGGLERRLPDVPERDRSPDRCLRVGYVSADFREHSAAYSFLPVIEHHDPGAFEVYCYSGVAEEDAVTARFRAASSVFVEALPMSDDELAARIRRDRIDILVDCSGHSAGNRLAVFARKPAPVQITAWGYANGTGLKAMDYLLACRILVPREHEQRFSETLLPLAASIAASPPPYELAQGPSPQESRGLLTFACLNRYAKVSTTCLRLWAGLLRACPSSRLLLKDGAYDNPEVVRALQSFFRGEGIDEERLTLRGSSNREQHLLAYNEVDLALDPFPSGGGATTLEALWMGVPTVALLGEEPNARIAGSLMAAAGHEDFVVASYEDYVLKALEMAARADYLQTLRRTLRERLVETPLFNPQLYTREVEAAYRAAWRRWCGEQSA